MVGDGREPATAFELVTVHSLSWLAAGNAVGLLAATLLVFPRLGAGLGALTYGRWMPLHLDLQLYGWCALPLVGLLLRIYRPRERAARLAVGLWSASLAFGAVSWLAGGSSGKLFLDWSGPARAFFAASLGFLALVLLHGFGVQVRRRGPRAAGPLAVKGLLLAALLAVPAVLYWAASPEVYPPINPASGGATGGSLLGSSLAIVAIVYGLPFALGCAPRDGGRAARWTFAALAFHAAGFALLGHGNHSHHEPAQLLGLASLAIWPPLAAWHLRRFAWPAACRRWLVALGVWGTLLVATGLVDFLPGVLERVKFTDALVAHAHVAMAGMVTCLHMVVLSMLGGGRRRRIFADPGTFDLWHAGAAVLVVSLLALGALEGASPGILFRGEATVTALYAGRWLGGALMTVASLRWLRAAVSVSASSLPREEESRPGASRCAA